MATPKSEAAQLRAELRRLWGLVDILIKALTGTLGAAGKVATVLAEEAAQLKGENEALREENRKLEELKGENEELKGENEELKGDKKSLEHRVKMHESWNHSSSEATGYAKDRRKFRREAERYRAKERGEDPDVAVPERSPGHQSGKPGVSHHDKPGDNRKSFVADMCPQCGRTDLKQLNKIQKLIREIVGLSRLLTVFLYSITPGMCPDCGIRILPHSGAIRGTSLGPKARATLYSSKAGKRSVIEAGNHFEDVHHRKLSNGAISNCMRAIAADIKGEVMEIRSKGVVLEGGGGRPFRSPVRPPPEPPANRYEEYDSLLARYGTVWTMSRPLPVMVQILEKSTMAPWSQTDESRHRIGKKKVQALVHDTPRTTTVSIAENRRRKALYWHAAGMAYRPMVHDGNKDNMRLRGWQPPEIRQSKVEKERRMMEWTQEVHQFDWVHVIRNVEGVNIDLNEFGTPEHTALDMLRDLYKSAKEAAKDVTKRAGGVIRLACDIDRVFRDPELLKYANERAAELKDALKMIIAGCGNAGIAAILENAAPYLFAFIYYPGMPPHNNGSERIVRSWVAVVRRANGPFPNWTAARNFSILQTFAATCRKNGLSAHDSLLAMAENPDWGIFTACVPPPIFGKRKAAERSRAGPS